MARDEHTTELRDLALQVSGVGCFVFGLFLLGVVALVRFWHLGAR